VHFQSIRSWPGDTHTHARRPRWRCTEGSGHTEAPLAICGHVRPPGDANPEPLRYTTLASSASTDRRPRTAVMALVKTAKLHLRTWGRDLHPRASPWASLESVILNDQAHGRPAAASADMLAPEAVCSLACFGSPIASGGAQRHGGQVIAQAPSCPSVVPASTAVTFPKH
jgi:hypothetical protein